MLSVGDFIKTLPVIMTVEQRQAIQDLFDKWLPHGICECDASDLARSLRALASGEGDVQQLVGQLDVMAFRAQLEWNTERLTVLKGIDWSSRTT